MASGSGNETSKGCGGGTCRSSNEEGLPHRAVLTVANRQQHSGSSDRCINKQVAVDTDAIVSLSIHDQVDALAQALLREFMHRRGYTKTLQTFDRECPRHEHTISSRQLMRQLLEIPSQAFSSRLSTDNGNGGGDSRTHSNKDASRAVGEKKKVSHTFMEELCSYRLQKREVQQRKQKEEEEEEEAMREGGDTPAAVTIDPSDAEMEEWRSAAAERERRIAETNARHEQLLHQLHEKKKKRKLEKLKQKREEEKKRTEDDERHYHRDKRRHGDRHGNDREEEEEEEGEKKVWWASRSRERRHRSSDIDEDYGDTLHSTQIKSGAAQSSGKGSGSGGLAEPEFLLDALEKRKASRATGHAVGSCWTPSGGSVTGVGLGRQLSSPLRDDDTANAEQPPSFLVGEGMLLMSDRMRLAKRKDLMEEWRSPSMGVVPERTLSGNGSMRGGAGFTPGALGSWQPKRQQAGYTDDSAANTPLSSSVLGKRTLGGSMNGVTPTSSSSPGSSGSVVVVVPPPPGAGILKTSTEHGSRGYDETARPVASALRRDSGFRSNNGNDDSNSDRVPSAGRKSRKVTILAD